MFPRAGVCVVGRFRILDDEIFIIGSAGADSTIAVSQNLPWLALWRDSDRHVANRHGVIMDGQ